MVNVTEEVIGKYKDFNYKIIFYTPAFSHKGHRCGYVQLPTDNKYYNKHYNNISNIDCHGGLTFSGILVDDDMPNDYWIGFDCAHVNDTTEICTKEYCIKECENIIDQLEENKNG